MGKNDSVIGAGNSQTPQNNIFSFSGNGHTVKVAVKNGAQKKVRSKNLTVIPNDTNEFKLVQILMNLEVQNNNNEDVTITVTLPAASTATKLAYVAGNIWKVIGSRAAGANMITGTATSFPDDPVIGIGSV